MRPTVVYLVVVAVATLAWELLALLGYWETISDVVWDVRMRWPWLSLLGLLTLTVLAWHLFVQTIPPD